MDELIRLRRQSRDIGIFGKKGVGKTILLVAIAFMEYCIFDSQIYSNFNVRFPHKRVRSMKDFDEIPNDNIRKIFLGDDFEYWFHSRTYMTKKNRYLMDVLLNWGKKNVSLIYSSKRELSVDKALRESTFEFWEVSLRQLYYHPDPYKNDILKHYLNFLYIHVDRFDENLDMLPPFNLKNLNYIVGFFDTKEEIKPLLFIPTPS